MYRDESQISLPCLKGKSDILSLRTMWLLADEQNSLRGGGKVVTEV